MAIKLFSRNRGGSQVSESRSREFYRQWDELRSSALSSSERAEIDAMFYRHDAEHAVEDSPR